MDIRNHNCVCQEGCVYVQAVAKILRSQCESNIIRSFVTYNSSPPTVSRWIYLDNCRSDKL